AEVLAGGGAGLLVAAWHGPELALALLRGGAWVGEPPRAEGLEGALAEARSTGQPAVRVTGEAVLLVEPLARERLPLVILGGGHVGRAVARAASLVDFEVTVVDDRPEFASPEALPGADRVVCRPFAGVFGEVPVDAEASVLVCTRGHLADAACLEAALATPARYVGAVGSRKKRAATLERLRAAGLPEERLTDLRMPAGLPLGADTPEEIAAAIVAELIQVRRKREP
ncbi:MAG: XdhC family protein, partial [Deferrisomatales bacterium]